jgi:exodeoxyribonuclease VII small subunit
MSAKKTESTFEDNFKLLETLARELQENKVSIDLLVPRMKEALSAIKVCKGVLKETKSRLTEINNEFEELNSEA